MDILLFQKINDLIGVYPALDKIVWFLAHPFSFLIGGLILLGLFSPKVLGLKNRFPIVLALVASFVSRFFVKGLIVLFYNRPRPFDVLEVNQLIEHTSFGAFPSGHTIFFFTLATTLIFYNRKLGLLLFITAALIGISRIFAGVHWPTDVLSGASLGILVGVFAFVIYHKIFSLSEKPIA